MRLLLPLALAAAIGCTAPGRQSYSFNSDPDYVRPFEILAAEYAVPVAIGLAQPGLVGGWNDGSSLRKWRQGWTHRPVTTDSDDVFVNNVLHPLSGSETHMIARDHGWSFAEAALFDAFGSLSWEYVFENVFERPSRHDLMVTAPFGMLIGELRWQAKQAGILPGLMDPCHGHGDPFLSVTEDGALIGVISRF